MLSILFSVAGYILVVPSSDDAIRASIVKGIARLEIAATNYAKNRTCFSCHHQAITISALATARQRGFKIDETVFKKQVRFTLDSFMPKVKDVRAGRGIGGANTTAAYALFTLQAADHGRDETTDALITFLVQKQDRDGGWTATTVRPPTEGSKFTSTALALQTFRTFAPEEQDENTSEATLQQLRDVRRRAVNFLVKTKPQNTEDRVFRLRGLSLELGSGDSELESAKQDLLQRQRPDGGWSQLEGEPLLPNSGISPIAEFFTSRTQRSFSSDAYATGSVLMALRAAGVSAKNPAYRKGIYYLLKTQDLSGGWIVTSRSRPIQLLFDNGDPGGSRSGFIGTAATGWAVLALLECCGPE